MRKTFVFGSLVLGSLLVAGCDSKDNTPVAVPAANSSTSTTPAMPSVDTTKMNQAVDNAKSTATDAMNQGKQAASDAADKAKSAVNDATNQAKSTGADAANETEAQLLLSQVKDYIKQNKLTDADTALTKLEGMKGNLPQSMQDEITALRTQLNSAKSLLGGSGQGGTPAMPSLPK